MRWQSRNSWCFQGNTLENADWALFGGCLYIQVFDSFTVHIQEIFLTCEVGFSEEWNQLFFPCHLAFSRLDCVSFVAFMILKSAIWTLKRNFKESLKRLFFRFYKQKYKVSAWLFHQCTYRNRLSLKIELIILIIFGAFLAFSKAGR